MNRFIQEELQDSDNSDNETDQANKENRNSNSKSKSKFKNELSEAVCNIKKILHLKCSGIISANKNTRELINTLHIFLQKYYIQLTEDDRKIVFDLYYSFLTEFKSKYIQLVSKIEESSTLGLLASLLEHAEKDLKLKENLENTENLVKTEKNEKTELDLAKMINYIKAQEQERFHLAILHCKKRKKLKLEIKGQAKYEKLLQELNELEKELDESITGEDGDLYQNRDVENRDQDDGL